MSKLTESIRKSVSASDRRLRKNSLSLGGLDSNLNKRTRRTSKRTTQRKRVFSGVKSSVSTRFRMGS